MATLTIADLDNGKRDLETVDAVANSPEDTTATRYGGNVLTLAGALRRLGYSAPVVYAPGLFVDTSLITVSKDGAIYAPNPEIVPFVTGAWNPAQWRVVQNTVDSNLVYRFLTLGDAQTAAATLPDGASIIVDGLSQGQVSSGAYVAESDAPAKVFQDYAAMEAYSGPASLFQIKKPGISGFFTVIAGDTSTPRDGGVWFVLADGRRVKRVYSGTVHLSWYQAIGDGSDETAKIQAALTAHPYRWVTGGEKQYTVKSLNLVSGQRIDGLLLKTLAGAEDFVSPITIDGRTSAKSDIVLNGVKIDGNRINQTAINSASEDGGRGGFRILGHVSNLYMDRCEANYCGTDGLLFFSHVVSWPAFSNIIVRNSKFNWNRRHGGAIDSTFGVRLENCQLSNNGLDLNTTDPLNSGGRGARQVGSLYGNGFDAESYGAGTHCVDLGFVNCDMLGNARSGLLVLPNGLDYGTAGWKPYAQIYVRGGRYDAGTETYSGKSPITFTALNLTSAQRGFTDIVVDGANCAIGGPTLKYVRSARVRCQAVELDAAGFHAGVIDSDDVELDLGLTSRPPVVYVANASVSIAYPFTGKSAPTLTAYQGCTVSNIAVEKISSSIYSGETFKITGKITQTATGSAGWMQIGAGGRTLLDAKIYALNPNNGLPAITGFNPAGFIGTNSGSVATHDFVATVVLR